MAVTREDAEHLRDLFAGLGSVTTRPMFGGLGIYHEGTIFALMDGDGGVLIKGKGAFVQALELLGCEQWVHTRKDGGTAAMPYWSLPDSARDDPEEAVALAREALRHL
jgi:DNA transformation protein